MTIKEYEKWCKKYKKKIQEELESMLHFDQGRDGTIENVIQNRMDVKTIRENLERLVELELMLREIDKLPICEECDSMMHKGYMCIKRQIEEILK